MTDQLRWMGLALIMGVFLGSFSVRQDTQDTEGKGISSDEMTMVEVKTVGNT